jgi:branched-chain amino acid transport system permease protein
MTALAQVLQYIISGITSGGIYAVIGICWSVVFLITQVLNFTTGEFVMLGGMLTWGFHLTGLGLPFSAALAISCTILTALALERLTLRPVRYPSEMAYMMITIAAASVIKGIVLLTWGSETRTIQPFFETKVIQVLGASLTPQALCILGLLLVVTAGLTFFFNYTLFGKALRASAISPVGASLIGVDSNRFRIFCFGLAGGLGAITGIVTAPIIFTGYEIGELMGLKGLVAAIVGGWTMTGTVIAALVLGLLEGLVAGLVSPGLKDVLSLLIMMVYLILRTVHVPHRTRRQNR